PTLSTTRRNRHHRPRRPGAAGDAPAAADVGAGSPSGATEAEPDPVEADDVIALAPPAPQRRNRHHRPRRRPAEPVAESGDSSGEAAVELPPEVSATAALGDLDDDEPTP